MGSSLLDSLTLGTSWIQSVAAAADAFGGFHAFAEQALLAESTTFLSRMSSNVWLGLQVALGLGFVIFVHELGHFLAAKTFGVRCDKFYVGFDVPISLGPIKLPSTLGKFTWGETEYGIGIIPLGGYVKMLGQDDDPRKAEEEAAKLRLGEGEDAPLDPRSYPAKPVWQRMIIISAGVIMNLIFAVILAGIAYWFGVPYDPTVTGSTFAGGPAWQAGLEPGDRIVSVGQMSEDTDKLRYEDFATEVVSHGFEFGDKPIPIAFVRDGKRIETSAVPTKKYHPEGFYMIGLSSASTATVGATPYQPDSYLAESEPDLKAGDRIVAVNSTKLPVSEPYDVIYSGDLVAAFQSKWREPVTVTIERDGESEGEATETLQLELPPVPVKSLGIGFRPGPVTALREDSPAKAAGLKPGDLIRSINGEPVEDALKLPAMSAKLAGQDITLGVLRPSTKPPTEDDEAEEEYSAEAPEGEEFEFTFANADRAKFENIGLNAGELTLGGVGIAFAVTPVISTVDESAAASGLQVGDILKQVHWVVTDEKAEEYKDIFRESAFEPMKIDSSFTVANLYDLLQGIPNGAKLELTVVREGKFQDPVALANSYQSDWFWHERGVGMKPLKDTYRAEGFAEAAALGLWETQRRFKSVLNFLKLLVTGRIGAKGLGGPGRIAYVAANEASNGPARLLIFLTMLSANLAILNFLPIPALDGGHMVFLTAEAVMGKPVNEALQIRLTMLGVLGLLSLMAFVIYRDILWFAS